MVLDSKRQVSAPPTALWAIPVGELGGVARHVLDVARVGLPGWRLVVLAPEGPLADRLRTLGTAVVTGPFGPAAGAVASARTLHATVRTLRPTVVHSHLSYADVIAAAVLAFQPSVKLVTTEHGIAADDLVYHGSKIKARIKALLHAVRLKRADAIIAVSRATRDAMVAKWRPVKRVTVIPNGVDVEAVRESVDSLRTGKLEGGPRILSLSRLSAEKRIPDLMRAFALLQGGHPTAKLTVAGEGPLRGELEQLAGRLGIDSSVEFPGFIDAAKAMANADVLVQLSVWENCSYTLLDAVSAGLGVVVTPVGGNPEIVGTANLVEADHHQAIASSVVEQWQHPSSRPNIPEQWPSLVKMAQETAAVYATLVSA